MESSCGRVVWIEHWRSSITSDLQEQAQAFLNVCRRYRRPGWLSINRCVSLLCFLPWRTCPQLCLLLHTLQLLFNNCMDWGNKRRKGVRKRPKHPGRDAIWFAASIVRIITLIMIGNQAKPVESCQGCWLTSNVKSLWVNISTYF